MSFDCMTILPLPHSFSCLPRRLKGRERFNITYKNVSRAHSLPHVALLHSTSAYQTELQPFSLVSLIVQPLTSVLQVPD